MVGQQTIVQSYSKPTFFFFVNSKSGNQQGNRLIQLGKRPGAFLPQVKQPSELIFIDLFDSTGLQAGIHQLSSLIETSLEKVFVIICGGDGTTSWVVNQLSLKGVNLSDFILGILPLGTGNDMCRSLGWDSHLDVNGDRLAKRINQWHSAEIQDYDVWQITLKTFENGRIYDIQNKVERNRGTTLSKLFTNYIGLGLDGRIVYTMERYRTSYPFFNRILYALVGCYNIFRPLKYLHTSIQSFRQRKSPENNLTPENSSVKSQSSSESKFLKRPLDTQKINLKTGFRGLVCLNSTSYMSGVKNIWDTPAVADKNVVHDWKPQSSGDGLLEFIAFRSQLNMAMERLVSSGGKVAQGGGPFEIVLNRPEGSQTTYIEIDGESIKVQNLRSIEIEKGRSGRLRVLSNR